MKENKKDCHSAFLSKYELNPCTFWMHVKSNLDAHSFWFCALPSKWVCYGPISNGYRIITEGILILLLFIDRVRAMFIICLHKP